MNISKQVKYLREFGCCCFGTVRQAILQAADTIESLSEKLDGIQDCFSRIDERGEISDLLYRIGKASECYESVGLCEASELMEQAVNMIASLAIEMDEENMKWFVENCGGEWTRYDNGENLPNKSGFYMVILETRKTGKQFTRKIHFSIKNGWHIPINTYVVAWQPIPELYHEP